MASHDSDISNSGMMYPATTENGEASKSMIPAPPMAPPPPPSLGGGFMPRGPEILTGPFNQTWLVNCLRRKWLSALLLGSLAAGIIAGVLLLLFPESSSVTALLELKGGEQDTVFRNAGKNAMSTQEFERFQQTQLTYFKSHFVLSAALARKEIYELEAVIKQGDDALTWLTDEINVEFPNKGEILLVSYDGEEDPNEMVKVIDAVIDSYMKEVKVKEDMRAAATRDVLRDLHRETADDLQEKIEKYQKLAKSLGGGETPIANTMLQMLSGEVRNIQKDIADAKNELVDLEVNRTLAIQNARSPAAIQRAVDEALADDPMMANFQDEKYSIAQYIRQLQARSKRPTKQLQSMQQQYQQLVQEEQRYRQVAEAEIRNRLKSAPNDELSAAMAEYVMRKENITKQIAELEARLQEKMDEILAKGERSGTLAMLEQEIEQLQEVVRDMDFKLRSEDVEDKTAVQRVRVMQNALPREKINKFERIAIAVLGGLGAFCATCYGVALLEFRRRRLNSPEDVDEGLGIRVLGVLPSVSSRKAMAPGSPIAAQLSESIDNVRATLMHDSTSRQRQVVLVTSPSSMEGCTTVASHLALSLSRAGRRTLLIDGDLREPSLHKLFGVPIEGGLSELLRAEVEVADALRPTNTEGLWLLSAGQCDMDAIHALAADQLQPIFEKLRAEFDFIIIDGAPVLGLSDSLSIGQYVDGAVLTVLRDHSEIRQVYQASELLKNMGIRIIGSVVNGVTTKADRRVARLHHLEAQQRRKLPAAKDELAAAAAATDDQAPPSEE